MFLNKKKRPIIKIGEILKIVAGYAKWSKIKSYHRIKLLMFIKEEKQKIN
jgi:hypothetical protein